jgi:ankyrin repeat protein/GAF domain-containing protein/CheY-like chemotaxis protein
MDAVLCSEPPQLSSYSPHELEVIHELYGITALHGFASLNMIEHLAVCHHAGMDINCRDRFSGTPLHYAALFGHVACCEYLLDHGADPSLLDIWKNDALILAAKNGHIGVIELLSQKTTLNIAHCNENGNTALHVATRSGSQPICEVLLAAKADPNRTSLNGWTCFHEAVQIGSLPILQLFSKYNHSLPTQVVNPVSAHGEKFGATLLHVAYQMGELELVPYLLAEGVNTNIRNSDLLLAQDIIAKERDLANHAVQKQRIVGWTAIVGSLMDINTTVTPQLKLQLLMCLIQQHWNEEELARSHALQDNNLRALVPLRDSTGTVKPGRDDSPSTALCPCPYCYANLHVEDRRYDLVREKMAASQSEHFAPHPAALRTAFEHALFSEEKDGNLEDITASIIESLHVDISAISVLDGQRQFFRSIQGLQAQETPVDVAFCAHGVATNEPLVILDAVNDPRTASNALVTAGPEITAYVGVPLVVENQPVGMVCAISTSGPWERIPPGALAYLQKQSTLASAMITQQTEQRKIRLQNLDTAEQLRKLLFILNGTKDYLVMQVTIPAGIITWCNTNALSHLLNLQEMDVLCLPLASFLPPGSSSTSGEKTAVIDLILAEDGPSIIQTQFISGSVAIPVEIRRIGIIDQHLALSIRDISADLASAQEASRLQKLEIEAKITADAETRFTQLLAHEIRNPLSGISLAVQFLEGEIDPSNRDLQHILKCTRYMDSLIGWAVDRSLIHAKRFFFRLSPTSPKALLLGLQRALLDHRIDLQLLPVSAEMETVTLNYDMHRLISCLVVYVMERQDTLHSTMMGKVTVNLPARTFSLHLKVMDRGRKSSEMSSEMRIYSSQLPITVASEILSLLGATFSSICTGDNEFIFPMDIPPDLSRPFLQNRIDRSKLTRRDLPEYLRVLIVDDSKMGRTYLRRALSRVGPKWTFDEAATAEEGILLCKNALFAGFPYQLVTLDQNMRDAGGSLYGTEAIATFLKMDANMMIIGCSGDIVSDDFIARGAVSAWSKPLPSIDVLRQDLEYCLVIE